jgi:steroid delta-isomerase-like uncharacterized protein
MDCLDAVTRYFDAWNDHDPHGIVRAFAAGGTYGDSTTPAISGDAIGAYAARLWSAFPDLSFEVVSIAEAGAVRTVAEWVMRGTNTGPFQGLPPTGRPIVLSGVDVIEIGADGITAVRAYFDTRAIPEHLGL